MGKCWGVFSGDTVQDLFMTRKEARALSTRLKDRNFSGIHVQKMFWEIAPKRNHGGA